MKLCHYVLGLEGSGKQHLLHPVAQAVPAYGEKRIYENCHFTWHQFAPNTQYQKISKFVSVCDIYIYIYIYTVCIYIYIYLFVNVPYIRWTVAKLLLYYSHLFTLWQFNTQVLLTVTMFHT